MYKIVVSFVNQTGTLLPKSSFKYDCLIVPVVNDILFISGSHHTVVKRYLFCDQMTIVSLDVTLNQ